MQEDNASNYSGSNYGIVFDPFVIGQNHSDHSESISIIELEESGKVFCLLCLKEKSHDDLKEIDPALFNLYVFNLFDALEQHSENSRLRSIALPVLDIILDKRPIRLESDLKFHNILRTIHKVMKSDLFNCVEFSFIAKIFSNISGYFIDSNPLPLISVWKASESLLSQATKKLAPTSNGSQERANTPYSLYGNLALIIKSYLMLVRRFAADQVSDLIFPISESDTVTMHNRGYYISSQLDCLQFMTNSLIPKCWPLLSTADRVLNPEENFMAGELFESIRECFESSLRLKNENFLLTIKKLDCIHVAHSIMYGNSDKEFKNKIRSYLEKFVYHYIQEYFESDEHLEDYASHRDIVETNHKNAILFAEDSNKYHKTVFYLMVNAVASKQNSKYFNPLRIRKVLKSVQPDSLNIRNSVVFMRTYCYLAAKIIERRSKIENVNNFITRTWKDSENLNLRENLIEIFCSDDTVLSWVYNDMEFQRFVSIDSIKFIIEQCTKKDNFERIINLLMDIECYKSLIQVYLRDEEAGTVIVEKILLADQPDGIEPEGHRKIVNRLSAILPALLHDTILDLNNQTGDTVRLHKFRKLFTMNVAMLRSCQHFKIILDEQFIIDLFKLIERMYSDDTNFYHEILIIFNEFITLVIRTNNEALMKVLKYLTFNTLGYMFHRLNNSTKSDEFAGSVARLLVSYDRLDYPLANNLVNDLFPDSMSVVRWMISQNGHLQILAFRFTPKVLKMTSSRSEKSCIFSALAHVLYKSPNLIRRRVDREYITPILKLEGFRYNPLVRHVVHKFPETFDKDIINLPEDIEGNRSYSPTISFATSEESMFEEEHISVSRILTELNEEERQDSSCRIPDSLFVTRAVEDQHSSAFDIDDWTRRALNST